MNGWIKLHRSLLAWEWFRDSETLHVFIYLLLQANHEPGKWKGIEIKRGQLITGRKVIAENTGVSERSIRTALNRLKSTSELTIKTTNKFSLITICNYDKYQSIIIESDQQNDQQTGQQTTNKRPANDHKQEYKEGEESKEIKEEENIYVQFLQIFNDCSGKKIRVFDDKSKKQFRARLKEGFTLEDFKTAIKNCKQDPWHIQNKQYLTPEFITRADKLQKYLNAPSKAIANTIYKSSLRSSDFNQHEMDLSQTLQQ